MDNLLQCLAFCTEQAHPDLPATSNKVLLRMLLPGGGVVLCYKIEKYSQQLGAGLKLEFDAEAIRGLLAEQSAQVVGLGVVEAHRPGSKAVQRPRPLEGVRELNRS